MARQERLDDLPQFIGYQTASHGAPPINDNCPLLFYSAPFLLEFLSSLCSPPSSPYGGLSLAAPRRAHVADDAVPRAPAQPLADAARLPVAGADGERPLRLVGAMGAAAAADEDQEVIVGDVSHCRHPPRWGFPWTSAGWAER